MTDSQEIFKLIKQKQNTMTFKEASSMFNDLAYVIIPFDKTNQEF